MDCSSPGFPVLQHLPELAQIMSIESMTPSYYLILGQMSYSPAALELSVASNLV